MTPINVKNFKRLLDSSGYHSDKARYLVSGFTQGFDFGYKGPLQRTDILDNIPIKPGVGSPREMWNKIMKEVKERHYAGPFERPPTKYYVQSPLGLVPKAGNKTRLIFHLSYDFGESHHQKSINWHTPPELCSVRYNDLDQVVRNSLKILKHMNASQLWYAKSDCSNAFRIVPGLPHKRFLLTMKAPHPVTKVIYYFVDKCMPFGASISCAIFQAFSDALRHIVEWKITMTMFIEPALTNYLDDFLFLAINAILCNGQVRVFLQICATIGCPISMEKTEWASQLLTFLGILMNGKMLTLSIPLEKKFKATQLLNLAIERKR